MVCERIKKDESEFIQHHVQTARNIHSRVKA